MCPCGYSTCGLYYFALAIAFTVNHGTSSYLILNILILIHNIVNCQRKVLPKRNIRRYARQMADDSYFSLRYTGEGADGWNLKKKKKECFQ